MIEVGMVISRQVWLWTFGFLVAFTTLLSLLPRAAQIHVHGVGDKLEHFLVYLALGLSGTLATDQFKRGYLFFALTILACSLEGLQVLVPGRSPGIPDALASSTGAAAGILAGLIIHRTGWLAKSKGSRAAGS
jgi:VanZ family protein